MASAGAGPMTGDFGEQFVIDRPGCRVRYWLTGPPGAPLVTLSHAALTDHTFFARQLPPLVSRFRVLTWDIRGHGASRPLAGAFCVADATRDLVAIMNSLGVERAVMLGQSMGTYVGQELAFRHPDRVLALIVIGGTCITADPGWAGRESLKAAVPIMRAWPYGNLRKPRQTPFCRAWRKAPIASHPDMRTEPNPSIHNS